MGWINLIFGSHALHNFDKAHDNVANAITTFFEPTKPNNNITNDTILTKFSIKQGLNVFGKKERMQYKINCSSFMTAELSIQISLVTSLVNNK